MPRSKIGRVSWRSRGVYRVQNRIGRVVYSEALRRYLLEDANMNLYQVDQEFSAKAREVEGRVNGVGKPPVCPGERPVVHGLTMSQRLWDKLGEPYSESLVKLLEGR